MTEMNQMVAAARGALVQVIGLAPADRVLVVRDEICTAPAEAFLQAARQIGCAAKDYRLPEDGRPLQHLPDGMASPIDDVDVVINTIAARSDEVSFRIEWIKLVEQTKRIRMGHSPGITAEMMAGGPMDIDYGQMRDTAGRALDALEGATSLRVTAPGGTDLVIALGDRCFTWDMSATEEHLVNLPCGEIFCAPLEDGAEGVLLVDGCFGDHGPVKRPIRMAVRGGKVEGMACEDPAVYEKVLGLIDTDRGSRTIAELGIGFNPGARMVGMMLEDEKAFRTAHIAFGSNEGLGGGQNCSNVHIDYLFRDPTIVALFADGSKKAILNNGQVAI